MPDEGNPRQSSHKPRSPYAFVPLNERVHTVGRPKGAIDRPFEDGICGCFSVRLNAESPLFVRGVSEMRRVGVRDEDSPQLGFNFYELPPQADSWAIPGSSLRGMLRNVIEIATRGRLRTNDHRYGVRDLTPGARDLYGRFMAEAVGGQLTPLVSAGWLALRDLSLAEDDGPDDEIVADLHPCSFAKVHYERLELLARSVHVPEYCPRQPKSAPDKYAEWTASREVRMGPTNWDCRHGQRYGKSGTLRFGNYASVAGCLASPSGGSGTQGVLVFTGQPTEYDPEDERKRRAKQNDFVFVTGERFTPIPVSRRDWRDFVFIHASDPQQRRLVRQANPELRFWLERLHGGGPRPSHAEPGIPVFFLPNDETRDLRIGLAMMFRLSGRFSTLESVRHHQSKDDGGHDIAEAIFGHVPQPQRDDRGPERPSKGRVSIGLCKIPRGSAGELPMVRAALALPKASYWPFYIEQAHGAVAGRPRSQPNAVENIQFQWHTWTHVPPPHEAPRPRGWKRYRLHRHEDMEPPLPRDRNGNVLENGVTRFIPLVLTGPVEFPIRVHNLRPFELGALLWALDFGGFKSARHQLGLAKSLGFGKIRLEVLDPSGLQTVTGAKVDLDAARDAFLGHMDQAEPGWAESETVRSLLAAGCPSHEPDEDLRHMRIQPVNEFQQVKRNGWVLPRLLNPPGWTEYQAAIRSRLQPMVDARRAEQAEQARRASEEAERRAANARIEQETARQAAAERFQSRPVDERLGGLRESFADDQRLAWGLWQWWSGGDVTHPDLRHHLARIEQRERQDAERWIVESGIVRLWNLPDQRRGARSLRRCVQNRARNA